MITVNLNIYWNRLLILVMDKDVGGVTRPMYLLTCFADSLPGELKPALRKPVSLWPKFQKKYEYPAIPG